MIFNNERKRRDRALELLELVGMSHKKNNRLNQLSGGEQQRIAIAIALANNPQIFLADEPTGAVDLKTGSYILDVFRELNRSLGLIIVIVTHDRQLSKKVNRVVAIRDGKTSSEMIIKQNYAKSLDGIDSLADSMRNEPVETHNEYAVLDRAGRVQIPKDMLASIGVNGNKVRFEVEDGKIIIAAPEE